MSSKSLPVNNRILSGFVSVSLTHRARLFQQAIVLMVKDPWTTGLKSSDSSDIGQSLIFHGSDTTDVSRVMVLTRADIVSNAIENATIGTKSMVLDNRLPDR